MNERFRGLLFSEDSIASEAQCFRSVEVAAVVEATLIKPEGAMHRLGVGVQQRLRGLDMRGATAADAVHVSMYLY
jgi:hypothetical protein